MLRSVLRIFITVVIVILSETVANDLCTTRFGYEFFIEDVMENTPINTTIGHVVIEGTDAEISLYQEQNDFFHFDPIYRSVNLTQELDTDEGTPETPNLIIHCEIRNDTGSTGPVDISVTVLVTDWNDNPPVFDKVNHTVDIIEDTKEGTIVYSDIEATDNDKRFDGNSRVFYRIVPNELHSDYFEIQVPTIPSITLKKALDYENETEMTILIEARDSPNFGHGPQRSSTATLLISIQDADDLNPVFSSISYRGTIREGALPGTVVTTSPDVYAYDPDTMNATIVYNLLDPHKFFTINPQTAEITNVQVFEVDVPTLTVVVLASQDDNPDREWFALLTISISEANINAPIFSKPLYEVTKIELEPVGSVLVTVTANDPDFTTVWGTFLVYDIVEDVSDIFTIDQGGNIYLQSQLDFEVEQERVIRVTASDGSHTSTATVKIVVLDVNDNNPQFVFPLEDEFFAELENDYLITNFFASDADINSALTFELKTNRNLFKLSKDGELRVSDIEAFGVQNRYALHIVVFDNGVPPREASKVIEVVFPTIVTRPATGVTKPTGTSVTEPTGTRSTQYTPVTVPVVEPQDNMMVIILGAIAGVLLVIIIILIVYMCWRNKRTKEELDKARAPRGQSAKGLTYRQAEAPDDLPKMDLRFTDDTDGISNYDVGATTVQQNPLRKQGVNEAYMQSSGSEMDRDVSEIEIETAVVPYDDDFGYPSGRPDFDGQFRTFRGDDTTSNESNHSDSTGGSQRVLVNANKNDGSKMTSWDSDDKIHPQGAQKLLDSKDSAASRAKKERPEITVYF